MQPSLYFIVSKRIGFRNWAVSDFSLAKELWGNPDVTRLFSNGVWSDERISQRLQSEMEFATRDAIQYCPIFDLYTNEFMGCCGLHPYDQKNKVYELGCHLLPAYWHKGIATEASQAAIAYGLKDLGASAICAGHHPENMASKNTLCKLGFTEVEKVFYEPTGLFHYWYILKKDQ